MVIITLDHKAPFWYAIGPTYVIVPDYDMHPVNYRITENVGGRKHWRMVRSQPLYGFVSFKGAVGIVRNLMQIVIMAIAS